MFLTFIFPLSLIFPSLSPNLSLSHPPFSSFSLYLLLFLFLLFFSFSPTFFSSLPILPISLFLVFLAHPFSLSLYLFLPRSLSLYISLSLHFPPVLVIFLIHSLPLAFSPPYHPSHFLSFLSHSHLTHSQLLCIYLPIISSPFLFLLSLPPFIFL